MADCRVEMENQVSLSQRTQNSAEDQPGNTGGDQSPEEHIKLLDFPLPHPVSADGLRKTACTRQHRSFSATVSILISDLKDRKIMTAESRCFQMETRAQSGC